MQNLDGLDRVPIPRLFRKRHPMKRSLRIIGKGQSIQTLDITAVIPAWEVRIQKPGVATVIRGQDADLAHHIFKDRH